MKRQLTVLHGQAPDLVATFLMRELTRYVTDTFDVRHIELPRGLRGLRYNFSRVLHNYLGPALRRPKCEFLLYGNDGVADLSHWRARRILKWYDAPADWTVTPPANFQQRLRYKNLLIADDIFAVSAAQVRVAKTLRPGREATVHYLPVGVDCEFFDRAKADPKKMRKKFGFGDDEVVVGYLGYLGHWGGRFAGEVLIEAAAQVKNPRVKYLVIGRGPAMEDWRRKISELNLEKKFVFAGFVDQADLTSSIAAADMCVDTLEPGFHSEARSETKLKQYMAMGCACIGTDIGENRVDLDNGAAGALPLPGPEPLAQVIENLSQSPDERRRLGLAARARAEAVYHWPRLSERFVKALNL